MTHILKFEDYDYELKQLVELQNRLIAANETGAYLAIHEARQALDEKESQLRTAILARRASGLALPLSAQTILLLVGETDAG